MQASDSHFIENASHYFNITEASSVLADVPSHFPELTEFLHLQKKTELEALGAKVSSAHGQHTSSEDVWIRGEQLLMRAETTLNWIANPDRKDSIKTINRYDTISNSEIHILNKLVSRLKALLADKSPGNKQAFSNLVNNGYQCSALQASQQELIAKHISMDICSEIEWYKVVQLAWPEARHFIDVGANKGYLGSLFVALWGGNGFKLAPVDILNAATRLESWKDSRNPAGYCKDGLNYGIPLHCPRENREAQTGRCNLAHQDLLVNSIDGSSYLAATLNHIIQQETPATPENAALREGKVWKYNNYAVSDVDGVAHFTKQSKETNAGFEGGSIRQSSAGAAPATTVRHLRSVTQLRNESIAHRQLVETEEVKMTTVDSFMTRHGLTHLDILKIDTEGNDNKVLAGAEVALSTKAGMFAFEGGKGVIFSKEMIAHYDGLGFSCYSTSRAGLFKWTAGCTKEQYMGNFKAKDKGNIFCVSRRRAPMASLAYDILSFPMMIAEHSIATAKMEPGPDHDRALLLDSLMSDIDKVEQVIPAMLVPFYLNIKPFCKPFPECARV
eukprot:CAMPEP_0184968798 /NCGR_PEP_ID=MMETSP1098-20130426/1737_1 /TAXON_ID=89044 /ORGANISM="Spumella elongata, Strain CCAP 955/1" /LENGTH=558 /DNA_ID=CAMNT_0027490463 /DNA_START=191 /DNA_END=1867 /DNA_ORIENTATION=+